MGLQGSGAAGVSNYLKNTLVPSVTDIRSANIYDSEITDLAGFPACTITLTEVQSKVLDNNRNEHIFKFSIKVFIDRTKTNFGNSTAESILRSTVNDLITKIDADPTLGGNCVIARPFNAPLLYINRENQNIRYMEVVLEVIDANTWR